MSIHFDLWKLLAGLGIFLIKNTLNAVPEKKIQEMEIASLLLVNRLFSQSCRSWAACRHP
jgi:hypothetical protein